MDYLAENYTVFLPSIIIFISFLAASFICAKFLGPFLAGFAQRWNHPCIAEGLKVFLKPSSYCLIALGALLAVSSLPPFMVEHFPWLSATGKAAGIACVVFFTIGLVRAVRIIPNLILGVGSKLEVDTSKAFSKFIASILQAFIILIAISLILGILGLDIKLILTSLGLGGLSFALAGQDIVSNIFGGIIISLERPFEIGDWVKTPDVEGSIEDISLRSTKIRTLDDALTIVPNQKFTSTAITNWTRLERRLAQFTLGLEYSTPPAVMEEVLTKLREMLAAHPEVYSDTIQVRFLNFNASSLDVYVQFYTTVTNIMEYRAVREDINLRIMKIFADCGASMAFPTQTVYMSSEPAVERGRTSR